MTYFIRNYCIKILSIQFSRYEIIQSSHGITKFSHHNLFPIGSKAVKIVDELIIKQLRYTFYLYIIYSYTNRQKNILSLSYYFFCFQNDTIKFKNISPPVRFFSLQQNKLHITFDLLIGDIDIHSFTNSTIFIEFTINIQIIQNMFWYYITSSCCKYFKKLFMQRETSRRRRNNERDRVTLFEETNVSTTSNSFTFCSFFI